MSRKVIVSSCPVIGLAILSIAALMAVPDKVLAADAGRGMVYEFGTMIKGVEFVPEPIAEGTETVMPKEVIDTYCSGIIELNWDEAYMLTQIAMVEAEGEDTEGKALVMLVVLNRVKSEDFPDSVRDVIYDERQFVPVSSAGFNETEPSNDCWKALDMITIEGWNQSKGALYFESEKTASWHSEQLEFLFTHGNHNFYK
ncbi:MAG: cell wall hydrolase [Lachnospiraceae bacterium]|nr:cell wall hydrolase [Lachnospiraceae bacterium]